MHATVTQGDWRDSQLCYSITWAVSSASVVSADIITRGCTAAASGAAIRSSFVHQNPPGCSLLLQSLLLLLQQGQLLVQQRSGICTEVIREVPGPVGVQIWPA